MALAKRIVGRFHDKFELKHFTYMHPERLQRRTAMRFRKPYPVKMAYTDWGNPARQTVICVGGVANTAMRFNYLSNDLSNDFRVVCMDWAGRGLRSRGHHPSLPDERRIRSRSRSRWRSTSIITLKVRASWPISSLERTAMLARS